MRVIKISEIKGYELFDGYTLSENGDIYTYYVKGMNRKYEGIDWSMTPLKMSTSIKSSGYKHLGIVNINGEYSYPMIHRLIALAFIPNPNNLKYVNHKNGNKLDNRIENLEWVTSGQNIRHAIKTGLMNHEHAHVPVEQYSLDGEYITTHESVTVATLAVGLKEGSKSAISRACQGKQKTSAGYRWKYANKK